MISLYAVSPNMVSLPYEIKFSFYCSPFYGKWRKKGIEEMTAHFFNALFAMILLTISCLPLCHLERKSVPII